MQNTILKTIISFKDEDHLNFKNRVVPGPLINFDNQENFKSAREKQLKEDEY